MNSETGVLLWSMPPGHNMDMGKEYDDDDRLCQSSLSQHLMQKVLLSCFILIVSSCLNPHVYLIAELWTCINSVNTFLYPYTLPSIQFPYSFSRLCLSCNLSSSLRSLHSWVHILSFMLTNPCPVCVELNKILYRWCSSVKCHNDGVSEAR